MAASHTARQKKDHLQAADPLAQPSMEEEEGRLLHMTWLLFAAGSRGLWAQGRYHTCDIVRGCAVHARVPAISAQHPGMCDEYV